MPSPAGAPLSGGQGTGPGRAGGRSAVRPDTRPSGGHPAPERGCRANQRPTAIQVSGQGGHSDSSCAQPTPLAPSLVPRAARWDRPSPQPSSAETALGRTLSGGSARRLRGCWLGRTGCLDGPDQCAGRGGEGWEGVLGRGLSRVGEGQRGEGGGDGGEVVRAVMWTERTGRPASLAGKVEQRGALRLERGRGEHAPQGW